MDDLFTDYKCIICQQTFTTLWFEKGECPYCFDHKKGEKMKSYTWLQENYSLDEEEAACVEWQFRFCGDFKTSIWQSIQLADDGNLTLLQNSFPVEVNAYVKYTRLDGWWPNVEKKIEVHHACHAQAIDQFNREKTK